MFDSVASCGASSSVMTKLYSLILNYIIFTDLTLMSFPGASLTNEPGPALFLSAYLMHPPSRYQKRTFVS